MIDKSEIQKKVDNIISATKQSGDILEAASELIQSQSALILQLQTVINEIADALNTGGDTDMIRAIILKHLA